MRPPPRYFFVRPALHVIIAGYAELGRQRERGGEREGEIGEREIGRERDSASERGNR